jgi:hypothetical protein
VKIFFYIQEGKITNPKVIKKHIDALPDGYYEMEVKGRNKRSLQQNAYYWGVVVSMVHEGMRDMGNDVSIQETHEFLKSRFNTKEVVNTTVGEVMAFPVSTTELNKEEFGQYIERVQQFAAEYLNIAIPNPGEQTAIAYE